MCDYANENLSTNLAYHEKTHPQTNMYVSCDRYMCWNHKIMDGELLT